MAKLRRPYIVNGIQIWLTGESEQEIADKYADLKYHMVSGISPPKQKHNFAKFATNNWKYIIQTVSTSTATGYREYLDKKLIPFFGKMNVEDITWRDVQSFYDENDDKAHSTVHKWKVVLSRILQIAVGDGHIASDPTKDKRLTHSKKKSVRPVPSHDDYLKLLRDISTLREPHERLYMAIIGYTGLRKGEALALRWTDIDFDNKEINVRKSIDVNSSNKKRPATIKAPKTRSGVRTVPLVDALRDILIKERHPYEFVVTDLDRKEPIHIEARFNTMWKRIKGQINLGPYTSHSYRHAMCTTLLSNGVDIKTTQMIIGHSQPSTTLNIYAHSVPNNIKEAGYLFNEKMSNCKVPCKTKRPATA